MRGSKTIILFGRVGVEDEQNCLREFSVLLHVRSFCADGTKRKSADPKQEHGKNWEKIGDNFVVVLLDF
jgi:hypothetical protein